MSSLQSLAQDRFGKLTRAEVELLRNADKGEVAFCGPSRYDDDPANTDEWEDEREIHGSVILWPDALDPSSDSVPGSLRPLPLDGRIQFD